MTARPGRKSKAQQPTGLDATTFFEATRTVEIVNWLAANPTELDELDWLADQIGDACATALNKNPGTHVRFADHFWCDVLASLALVLDRLAASVTSLPAAVAKETAPVIATDTWNLVAASRSASFGNRPSSTARSRSRRTSARSARDNTAGLATTVLQPITEKLVKTVLAAAAAGTDLTFAGLILKLRVLAILFCPDPYAHQLVWDECVVPLVQNGVVIASGSILTKLLGMFKTKWSWPR